MKKQGKWCKCMAFLMLAGLVLLAACGQKQGENPAQKENSEIAENIDNAKNPEGQEELPVSLESPVMTLKYLEENVYTEDGEQILVSGSCELPSVQPVDGKETHPELRKAVEDWSLEQSDRFWETLDQYEADARMYWEQMQSEPDMLGDFLGFSIASQITYTRTDDRIVSFQMLSSDYTGGAHGMYTYSGATFDAAAGKELTCRELLQEDTDFTAFCEAVTEYCIRRLEETHGEYLWPDYPDVVREGMSSLLQENFWYLDEEGIVLVFNPYQIAPYAAGAVFVTLPYEEFADVLRPEYFENLPYAG